MVVDGTPVEAHPELGLWVKREDLSCPVGPHFSKSRGVFAHVRKRNEEVIGVLDTVHSQGGWAVAQACRQLGKLCRVFYPVRKADPPGLIREPQQRARELGADLVPLQAGMSAVLWYQARRRIEAQGGYMMPNALKLTESVEETAAEVARTDLHGMTTVLVSASSGTIAAGLQRGLFDRGWNGTMIVHLGYSRPEESVRQYITRMSMLPSGGMRFVDEGYAYADKARPMGALPFPANDFYDRKAVRWWVMEGRREYREALLWLIG
jgi:hypothetical protein